MTNKELIKQVRRKYQQQANVMRRIPNVDFIGHVSGNAVFMRETDTYEEFIDQVSCFPGCEFNKYYLCWGTQLGVVFNFLDMRLSFYCNDSERVLKEFLDVDCTIEEEEYTTTERRIKCNLEG